MPHTSRVAGQIYTLRKSVNATNTGGHTAVHFLRKLRRLVNEHNIVFNALKLFQVFNVLAVGKKYLRAV